MGSERFAPSFVALLTLVAACTVYGGVTGWDGSDTFAGPTLNSCNWQVNSYNGSVLQSDGLILMTNAQPEYSSASVRTQYTLIGDFDVSADFVIQGGFDTVSTSSGARVELSISVFTDARNVVSFQRTEDSGRSGYGHYALLGGQLSDPGAFRASATKNGTLRLTRLGPAVTLRYRDDSTDWTSLDRIDGLIDPVFVSLGAAHFSIANQVKVEFLNFKLLQATTSARPFTRPPEFRSRPDFHIGGVVSDYLAAQFWGSAWHSVNPLDILKANGFDAVRVGMLTTSSSLLAATPTSQWSSLGWHNEFWGSREYATEILSQAAARGFHLNLFFFLSDQAAYAGRQPAPAAWAGLSVDDTASAVEAFTFGAASDLVQKGLHVEIYDVGNEIDYGILNFTAQPGSRITVPNGIDVNRDFDWMRANVWNIEAALLKAAIRGIRRADPAAKVVLHITTHPAGDANAFERAFFSSMITSGVDFDYAGLSLPYATGSAWVLNQFTTDCWFQRLQDLFDLLQAMGKGVLIGESAALNAPDGTQSTPMTEFPFSYDGQDRWMREHLRFLSGHPNVVGFDYFYPEYFPRCCPSTPDLEVSGLFAAEAQPAAAMAEARINLVHLKAGVAASGTAGSFSASTSPSVVVTSYRWNFGDGTTSNDQNAMHTYAKSGTYPWRLTVVTNVGTVYDAGSISISSPRRRAVSH